MMPEQAPSQAHRLAVLAVSGLLAGLPACAAPTNNEIVVDPTAPLNTGSATPVATATAEPAEEAATEPTDEPPKPRARKPRTARRALADCCAGKNDCKGLGGCKTDRHDCRGKNDCKGLGGCQVGQCEAEAADTEVAPPPPPPPRLKSAASPSGTKMCCKGQNECKGKGNCKTNDNACKGLNDCKGKGGCAGPC